tara:strand:+ start:155087 stop:155323 length:237 start_codon:yes stop_codon:yes gene_type:complete
MTNESPQSWADAMSSIPALNADVVFIQTAMDSLIRDRSPAPGDTAALDKVADDAVYLSNRIFERLQAQLEEPTAAIES